MSYKLGWGRDAKTSITKLEHIGIDFTTIGLVKNMNMWRYYSSICSTGNQRLNRIALGGRDAVSVKMHLAKNLPVNNSLIRGLETTKSFKNSRIRKWFWWGRWVSSSEFSSKEWQSAKIQSYSLFSCMVSTLRWLGGSFTESWGVVKISTWWGRVMILVSLSLAIVAISADKGIATWGPGVAWVIVFKSGTWNLVDLSTTLLESTNSWEVLWNRWAEKSWRMGSDGLEGSRTSSIIITQWL